MNSQNYPILCPAKSHRLLRVASAFLLAISFQAKGVISIGLQEYNLELGETPSVEITDLINTGSSALSFYNTTFPDPFQRTHDGATIPVMLFEGSNDFPAMTTFYLNTAANPSGYRIDSFSVTTWSSDSLTMYLSGYEGSGRNHHYMIDYSVVGSEFFETLTTIDIAAHSGAGYTKVSLSDLGLGTAAVDIVRMTWLDPLQTDDSVVFISEIDIRGAAITQVPEPGAATLMLGTLFLLGRRRRES